MRVHRIVAPTSRPGENMLVTMTFAHSQSHDRRLLWYALGSVLLVNVGIWAVYHLLGLGSPANMKGDWLAFLHVRQWTDSWLPMLKSLDYFRDHPNEPIYYAKLYDTLIYPLPSLLPMVLLRKLGLGPHELRILAVLSLLACFGVLGFSLLLAREELRRRGGSLTVASVLAVAVVWAGLYPLFKRLRTWQREHVSFVRFRRAAVGVGPGQ